MENRNNENYGQENRDFNQDLDTLIDKDGNDQSDNYQNQEEFIDDVNHQTNDYNRNENNPGEEPILNGEDQITNDQESDDYDDDFNQNDHEDDDEDDLKEEDEDDLDEDLDEVTHDPFPSLNPEKF